MAVDVVSTPLPPDGVTHVTETRDTTTPTVPSGWLHTNLRNILAILITLPVVYLSLLGNTQAQAGLIAAFSVLVGMIWGERSALKVPGKDT